MICLCGSCGQIDDGTGENGFCKCGADYWIEPEDLGNIDLYKWVKDNPKGMTIQEIFDIFEKELK